MQAVQQKYEKTRRMENLKEMKTLKQENLIFHNTKIAKILLGPSDQINFVSAV